MKNMEFLGLSVVAAALIMTTGCSSSSDDNDNPSGSSGPSAPSEITTPVQMDSASAKNAMAFIQNGASAEAGKSTSKALAAKLAPAKAPSGGSGEDSNTNTYECDISGTRTESYTSIYHNASEEGGSWSNSYTRTTTYDNCVDEQSDNYSKRTRTGSDSYNSTNAYNADTNMSSDSYSSSSTVIDVYENDENNTSKITINNEKHSGNSEYQGEERSDSSTGTYKDSWSNNGMRSYVSTDAAGNVISSYKNVYGNQIGSEEGVQDGSKGTHRENGFYARYNDYNKTSDEWQFDNGYSYTNFVATWSKVGDESEYTVNGQASSECLGGNITFKTTTLVQENQMDYFDGDDHNGSNVLPYTGGISMTGTGTATVAFSSDDTNHTSALLSAGGVEDTLERWSDLAIGNCGDK